MFADLASLIESIQPLYLVNILLGFTITICVLIVAAGKHRDLMIWASGFGLYVLAFVLFGLRSELPLMVSVIGGNGALGFMFAMFVEGLARLYRVPISRWFIWLPPLLSVVGFVILLDDFDSRVILGVASSTYHSILVLFLVFKGLFSTPGRGRWIVFFAIVFHALILLIRALLIVSGVIDGSGFLSPSAEQTVYLSMSLSTIVMFAFGLLVVYKERAESDAWREAHYDPLTNVSNRRVLKHRLQGLSLSHERSAGYCAIILLDLDNFKALNDTYGHTVGDRLLVLAAQRIKHSLDLSDEIIRLGGDEFLILLEHLGDDLAEAESKALTVAKRILAILCQPYQLDVDGDGAKPTLHLEYTVTASMGIELFQCKDANREAAMSAVDQSMYKAKQAGRNAIFCRGRICS